MDYYKFFFQFFVNVSSKILKDFFYYLCWFVIVTFYYFSIIDMILVLRVRLTTIIVELDLRLL